MADRTSSQDGLWSATSTWGGAAKPGIGDRALIGHNVTVDENTTVGTSPNDTTTFVIDMTALKTLTVNAGITLTIRGNKRHINGCILTLGAGASVIFDNSASGGSPVYVLSNVGFTTYNFNGTSGARCTFGAIAGQTCNPSATINAITATFTDFNRLAALGSGSGMTGAVNVTDCVFTGCGRWGPAATTNNKDFIFRRNRFSGGTHATDDMQIAWSTAAVSGAREITDNVFTKMFNNLGKSFLYRRNYFGAGVANNAAATWTSFRGNFVKSDGTINGGNGQLMPGSFERNYWVIENGTGNPHFVAPTALLGVDNNVSQNIGESQTPDAVDVGDFAIVKDTATAGGFKVIGKNNIVLPTGGSGVSSGTLLTIYNAVAAVLTEWSHNTGNVNKSAIPLTRSMFAVAEAGTGFAGQVPVLKSNVAWGNSVSQGYLVERITGNVKDIITAAGADKNWVYNTSAGDNQRGYEDVAAANTLWTAGDAVAASVDVNQGSGNPAFVDSARNIASWCAARGYGAATYAAGLTALQADITRIEDLINYVFEGNKPTNLAMRSAAHDGACVGAANFHKTARSLNHATNLRSYLTTKYGVG